MNQTKKKPEQIRV